VREARCHRMKRAESSVAPSSRRAAADSSTCPPADTRDQGAVGERPRAASTAWPQAGPGGAQPGRTWTPAVEAGPLPEHRRAAGTPLSPWRFPPAPRRGWKTDWPRPNTANSFPPRRRPIRLRRSRTSRACSRPGGPVATRPRAHPAEVRGRGRIPGWRRAGVRPMRSRHRPHSMRTDRPAARWPRGACPAAQGPDCGRRRRLQPARKVAGSIHRQPVPRQRPAACRARPRYRPGNSFGAWMSSGRAEQSRRAW